MYGNWGGGEDELIMIGLTPYDNNTKINNYKQSHNLTLHAAGTQGGGPAAIDIVTDGQNFLGYPTYCVVCPDKEMSFDVCWPPTAPCFDPYIEDCIGSAPVTANFSSDITELCDQGTVSFLDESTGNITSWQWSFEGGEPATSTEQNPVVTYSTPGTWDVTLTVSNGTGDNTIEMPDYISVFENPVVTLQPFDTVCLNWEPFELTGGQPAGGEYSGTGVSNNTFYPANAGVGTFEITYTYTDGNGCEGSAVQNIVVDGCTSIDENNTSTLSIYPNPANNIVNVVSDEILKSVSIFNYTGQKVKSLENIDLDNVKINTSGFKSGVYLFRVETDNGSYLQRVVVR